MGIRVEFWLGAKDGIKGHFLGSPLEEFLEWSRVLHEEEPAEVSPTVLDLIAKVIHEGEPAIIAQSPQDAETIDRMIDLFYGYFCDCIRPELCQEADESALSVFRYRDHRSLIGRRCSKFALSCWDHLLNGRSIARPDGIYPYKSADGVFKVGYWTFEESKNFLELLDPNFGNKPTAIPFNAEYSDIYATIRALRNAVGRHVGLILTVA